MGKRSNGDTDMRGTCCDEQVMTHRDMSRHAVTSDIPLICCWRINTRLTRILNILDIQKVIRLTWMAFSHSDIQWGIRISWGGERENIFHFLMTRAFYLDPHKTVKMFLNVSLDNDPNQNIDQQLVLGEFMLCHKQWLQSITYWHINISQQFL